MAIGVRTRAAVKWMLPPKARELLRKKHRQIVFRISLTRFLQDPAGSLQRDGVLRGLVYGWNNSWSVQEEYLVACVEHALACDGPILECGSGLSTILVGAIAKTRGIPHVALEHSPPWAGRVNRQLARFGIATTTVCRCRIEDFCEFAWYATADIPVPGDFSLVICDGPPQSTRGGRYGLLPRMRHRLAPSCTILLDDTGREGERKVAARWVKELGAGVSATHHGTEKPFMSIRLPASDPVTARLQAP